VKTAKVLTLLLVVIFSTVNIHSQETDKSLSVSLFTGAINYQGDLHPNSFTFAHSNFAAGITFRKPLNRWLTFRAGVHAGKIEAADKWNREYLQPRNLSFTTSLQEIHAGFEINILDISSKRFTPFLYGGIAAFHFNPWAYDNSGNKTYLQPLSTEGQGLSQYPKQKPYQLLQFSFAFGGGIKVAVSDALSFALEINQRKTFTDYLDDVSSIYIDRDILLQEKGSKAVEMAYRGGLSPQGSPQYPQHGEQRGTASEMDWYYFFGLGTEIKLNSFDDMFRHSKKVSTQRCPKNLGF